jgi:adenylate kinase family enzyme
MLTRAILLLGPTGAGKSPLGKQIEQNGIGGKRCFHFDFGYELRNMAGLPSSPEGFREDDLSFIRDVLEKGLLLENEHFHIAKKIVRYFLSRNAVGEEDILVLNGLPRHVDQAKDMSGIVSVMRLVVLACGHEEVYKRIELNSGGDRAGRPDDSPEMIRNKLEIFKARTAPLIEHFSDAGCDVLKVRVTAASTPEESYRSFIAAYEGKS